MKYRLVLTKKGRDKKDCKKGQKMDYDIRSFTYYADNLFYRIAEHSVP